MRDQDRHLFYMQQRSSPISRNNFWDEISPRGKKKNFKHSKPEKYLTKASSCSRVTLVLLTVPASQGCVPSKNYGLVKASRPLHLEAPRNTAPSLLNLAQPLPRRRSSSSNTQRQRLHMTWPTEAEPRLLCTDLGRSRAILQTPGFSAGVTLASWWSICHPPRMQSFVAKPELPILHMTSGPPDPFSKPVQPLDAPQPFLIG